MSHRGSGFRSITFASVGILFGLIICRPVFVHPQSCGSELSISEKKCLEYESAVVESIKTDTVGGGFYENRRTICFMQYGKSDSIETVQWEFPHMAYIIKGGLFCGGTLISEEFVLTSTSCIIEVQGPTHVLLGMHSNAEDLENRSEFIQIADYIHHPENYIVPRDSVYHNDITLVRLAQPIKLTPYLRPACLPADTDTLDHLHEAIAPARKTFISNDSLRYEMLKTRLDLLTEGECSKSRDEMHICAGSRTNQGDRCIAIDGGPLQIQHPNESVYCMYTVLGLLSSGQECETSTAKMFTRVQRYVRWIESVVWAEKPMSCIL